MFAHCDTLPPASLNEHATDADVAESAYAQDLKSWASQGREGSSPSIRTNDADDMILSKKTGLPKGIRKRGPVFQVSISMNGARRTGTAGSLDEALVLRDTLTEELKVTSGKSWSLQTAIEKTEATVWRSARSQRKLRALADEAVRFFGKDTPLRQITTDKIDEYTIHLKESERNSGATVNRKLAALSKVSPSPFSGVMPVACSGSPTFRDNVKGLAGYGLSRRTKKSSCTPGARSGRSQTTPTRSWS